MNNNTLLATGVFGSLIAALCCFTPILVVAFGVLGVSHWLDYADYVLLPALAFFLAVTGYAIYRRCRAGGANPDQVSCSNPRSRGQYGR
jgi:mercuric ion transport protein